MKDFIGQELAVGDRVIFMWKRWRDRRQLCEGVVKSLSPQTCLIAYHIAGFVHEQTQRQYYDQVIRHPVQREDV